mgnify:CR=1 FL=1
MKDTIEQIPVVQLENVESKYSPMPKFIALLIQGPKTQYYRYYYTIVMSIIRPPHYVLLCIIFTHFFSHLVTMETEFEHGGTG